MAAFFASFSPKLLSKPDFSHASRERVLINESAVVNLVASHPIFQSREALIVLSRALAHWRRFPDFATVLVATLRALATFRAKDPVLLATSMVFPVVSMRAPAPSAPSAGHTPAVNTKDASIMAISFVILAFSSVKLSGP